MELKQNLNTTAKTMHLGALKHKVFVSILSKGFAVNLNTAINILIKLILEINPHHQE